MTELTYARSWALDNIEITRSSDGRTVEAYAAIFGVDAEIHDQHGDYIETIDRHAFSRTLPNDSKTAMCLYNHGYTVHGTPSELGSVPLGTPVEIRSDARGLLTVTRYNKSQLADATLEAIRNGDIRSQSFRGRIYKSDPDRAPGRHRGAGSLPRVTRMSLGLGDYGPTPTAAYREEMIVAVRSAQEIAEELTGLDADLIAELIRTLSAAAPVRDTEPATTAPTMGLGAEDLHAVRVLSGRLHGARARARIELSRMGARSGKA